MLNNAPKSAEVIIDVPFFDVDAMQVVWHGHYVKYLEVARCELLRSFHYDYNEMSESGYMWPIVDMSLKYVGSALFAHKIKVTATLKEWENRLRIEYLITDLATGKKLTKASTTQVAIDMKTRQMCFESPGILFEKLGYDKP
ncbi:acyl-CoA thioesterase [Rheinheimera aquimaris]|uniref:acyl-CoA thioesterase n=1 Tax=Rheinheimera aquimaris TaxID=412437 RepID=UPI003A971D63|tara:strand:+ start:159 stop:584 length:426 start_codon:yes stop_codon:yes gene_type:complete